MHIDVPQEQIAAFCRKWKIREFALFGSVLRDDFRPDSDVDVLVEFDPDAEHSVLDHVRMERETSEIFGRTVHLVEKNANENPLHRALVAAPHEKPADLVFAEEIRRALDRAVMHVVGLQRESFDQLQSLQDSVVRQLIVVAEMVKRLSPEFRARHFHIPWDELAGLKEVLVHAPQKASPARIWSMIVKECLEIEDELGEILGIPKPVQAVGWGLEWP